MDVTDSLEVVALSDHEWRVSDASYPAADGRRVLAYVENVGGYVMVMWLSPGDGWAAFPGLDAALAALRRTCALRRQAA